MFGQELICRLTMEAAALLEQFVAGYVPARSAETRYPRK